MRKRKVGRKFGRERAQRKALIAGIVEALFRHGRIATTAARAKESQRVAERAITTAKKDTIAARRQLERTFSPKVVHILVSDIAPRFAERRGGYTRIVNIGPRRGDRAPMVYLELVE